jgi:iron complex outermembrane recepter protein
MGVTAMLKHKARAIIVYRQGGQIFLVSEDPDSFAAEFAALHGPGARGFAVRFTGQTQQGHEGVIGIGGDAISPIDPVHLPAAVATPDGWREIMLNAVPRGVLAAAVAFALWPLAPAVAADAADAAAGTRTSASSRLDEIEVAAKGTASDWPSALATDVLDYRDAVAAPLDFQDFIVRVPGVDATGQNGIFETFSIRGSGGNGILVLVGGMPVTAQRRAGVPVAFVEPALLGDVAVTRGPAVVHYGPGALGGAVSIEPRWFDATTLSAGYASSGDETTLVAATGTDDVSFAAARHHAGDSAAPDGTPLNASFERESATLQYRAAIGDVDLDAMLLPSRTRDIGKSNSRFPVRDTTYPVDRHTLGRLRLRHANGVEFSLHGHDQLLETYNRRPGSPDTFASISSTDVGATLQREFGDDALDFDIGMEFLGRRDVTGFDARGTVDNRTYSLDGASEDDWSLFALSDWSVSPTAALEFGARASRQEQQQSGAASDDSDAAFTAGAVWAPDETGRWTFNLSSGYRFATLEERFFSGVTAQGEIVGNPDLGSEHSLGADLGYAWRAGDWGGTMHVWRTEVDDLIQLVELAPDVNGYVNVGEAELHGVEATLDWQATDALALRAGGAVTRGENKLDSEPLYGIGPVSATLEAIYAFDDFRFGLFYSHRWDMDRPGFEEVARDAVDVVDADVHYRITPRFDLQLYLRNAFDENYFATADQLATFAPERSVGFNLVWRGP